MFSVFSFTLKAISAMRRTPLSRELHVHLFGAQQRLVLRGQRGIGLGEDAHEVVDLQRIELHANREAALQLRNQIRRLRHVERARGDEQDVIGLDLPVLRGHGAAFDQRQQVALHAFARHVGADGLLAARDLVDLVDEHDAVLLGVVRARVARSSSSLTSLPASSSISSFCASFTLSLRGLVRLPPRFANMLESCSCISSMPGGAMISTPAGMARSSSSISRSFELRLRAASCGISGASPDRAGWARRRSRSPSSSGAAAAHRACAPRRHPPRARAPWRSPPRASSSRRLRPGP